MAGKVGNRDGKVTLDAAMHGKDGGVSLEMTPSQAERIAHALLLQAYCARGNTPGERQFRTVKAWVLR